ncbi:hypothetical protein BJ742DRAFT_902781 [Cladochytrium replicatum]|nr:hypothetical protein BJ742DRAFT_902781 [Cladochytrium replicatum]
MSSDFEHVRRDDVRVDRVQKPAQEKDGCRSLSGTSSQPRMDSGVDILKQNTDENTKSTVPCTPSALLNALTPLVSVRSRSEDSYKFVTEFLDFGSNKPSQKIERPRQVPEERTSLVFEEGDAFVYVRGEKFDKAVARTGPSRSTPADHERCSSSNDDVREYTSTGENLKSRDNYSFGYSMRSHNIREKRHGQIREINDRERERERESKMNRSSNSFELPPIYGEKKIISSMPDIFSQSNLQSAAKLVSAKSGLGVHAHASDQPFSLENKTAKRAQLQVNDYSDLFRVDTNLFLAGMIEPWTEGVNLLSDFHKFGPEAAAVAALGTPLDTSEKRTRGTPVGANPPKKKIESSPESREKSPPKSKTSMHKSENSSQSEGGLEPEKKPAVPSSTSKHTGTSTHKQGDSEAILHLAREHETASGATKKISTRSPRASLSLKTRRYVHPDHANEPPQQLVPTRTVVGASTGDEEWHRQRIVATLTMKELKKIFPPLMKQCLRRRRQQQQMIQQKVELTLRERPNGEDSKGSLGTMLPASTSLVAPPIHYVHMERESQQHPNLAIAGRVEGQAVRQSNKVPSPNIPPIIYNHPLLTASGAIEQQNNPPDPRDTTVSDIP